MIFPLTDKPLTPLDPPSKGDDLVRGQSLILARWIAIFGQAISILVSYYGLGFIFPVVPAMGFVVLSGLVNNYAYIHDHHRTMPPSRALAYLVFDVLQLASLLYMTGGIDNPFSVLLVAPVLVGASLLSSRYMSILMFIGLSSSVVISISYIPLIWPDNLNQSIQIHKYTQSLGLFITLLFAGIYAWKISEENRSIQRASYAVKTALLKQKQLQALGAQAAAAVHELGSPLGTITIIAKELSHELGEDHPQSEDISILISQTKRCQNILRDFGATLRHDPTYMAVPIPVADLLQNIANEFLKEKPSVKLTVICPDELKRIKFTQSAEIIHGFGVFIQNALQFAQSLVTITISKNRRNMLEITIADDGHGFAPHILSKLGEPYTSTRIDSGKNMGLGIFIAQTMLEDTGASITYNNRPKMGAQVKLAWTEADLRIMFQDNKL